MGGPLAGPRPDPGPGGRAKPKPKVPKVLEKPVPFTVTDVTPKRQKSPREKGLLRTGETMKAAIAIKRGKAEAHPRMGKPGALGELEGLTPKEKGSVERTFRESLEKSAPRRGKKALPRKPTGIPRGNLMAGKRRKPVRRSSRMSGSGR